MSNKGIVYILTNPCLEGWVKIGMSDKNDIKERLAGLNSPSSIPLSFRAYALYHVENPKAVESAIHKIIDTIDYDLRSREIADTGRDRVREFFRISPEKARDIFTEVAKLRGDTDSLELIEPSEVEQEQEAIVLQRRPKLYLKDIGIPKDGELTFVNDETITCKADIENNKLFYEDDSYSIAALAIKLLNEKCGWHVKSIAGASYFKYMGQTLADIRDQKEIRDGTEEKE
jgi:hypothetical protein